MTETNEFTPADADELGRFLAENAQGECRAVLPVGGRTALDFGYPLCRPGIAVSTSRLTKVVDYPARDMTITVEAGIRLSELADVLTAERQQLPIDIPQAERATLGGVLAVNPSGTRRFGHGTLRDYVIGLTAVDAQGRTFHSGGRVVKNVAGYDLCKLLIGSLGTLAVVSQVTLKLRPVPESSVLLWLTFPDLQQIENALARLLTSETRPVCLDVLNPPAAVQIAKGGMNDLPTERPVLVVGYEGSARETAWQIDTLKQEIGSFAPSEIIELRANDADVLRRALTAFSVQTSAPLTFRASVLPSGTIEFLHRADQLGVTALAHAGNGIVVGRLPDEAAEIEQAGEVLSSLRAAAHAHQGNVVVLHCDNSWKSRLSVFGDPPPSWPLMQKIKAELDPHNLLSPGRLTGATDLHRDAV
jgi:glycolate oxidase FAD binding subunit